MPLAARLLARVDYSCSTLDTIICRCVAAGVPIPEWVEEQRERLTRIWWYLDARLARTAES